MKLKYFLVSIILCLCLIIPAISVNNIGIAPVKDSTSNSISDKTAFEDSVSSKSHSSLNIAGDTTTIGSTAIPVPEPTIGPIWEYNGSCYANSVGDIDGDGQLEMVMTNASMTGEPQLLSFWKYDLEEKNWYQWDSAEVSGVYTWAFCLDVDHDGQAEILVTKSLPSVYDYQVQLVQWSINGLIELTNELFIGGGPYGGPSTYDFDMDGVDEISLGNGYCSGASARVLKWEEGQLIELWRKSYGTTWIADTHIENVDNDEEKELVVIGGRDGEFEVFDWTGTTFTLIHQSTVAKGQRSLFIDDFNQNGINEIVIGVGWNHGCFLTIYEWNGADFVEIYHGCVELDNTHIHWGEQADVTGDGIDELLINYNKAGWGGEVNRRLSIRQWNGADFVEIWQWKITRGHFMVVEDVDGDGFKEIYATDRPQSEPVLWQWTGMFSLESLADQDQVLVDLVENWNFDETEEGGWDNNNHVGIPKPTHWKFWGQPDYDHEQYRVIDDSGAGGDAHTVYARPTREEQHHSIIFWQDFFPSDINNVIVKHRSRAMGPWAAIYIFGLDASVSEDTMIDPGMFPILAVIPPSNPTNPQGHWPAYGTYSTRLSGLSNSFHHYRIYVSIADYEGNPPAEIYVEFLRVMEAIVDSSPPVTEIHLSGSEGMNGWFTSDVTMTLTASDDLSESVITYYRINYNDWIEYSSEIIVSEEGTTFVEYYSIDQSGNTETIQETTILIDKTLPTTTAKLTGEPGHGGWYVSDVMVELTAIDSVSGVTDIMYLVTPPGGQDYLVYSDPFVISDEGVSVVHFYAIDEAGNSEFIDLKNVVIKIDKTPPHTKPKMNPQHFYTDEITGDIYVTSDTVFTHGSDSVSGEAITYYRINGGEWLEWLDSFQIFGPDGFYLIEFYGIDNAGNIEPIQSMTVILVNLKVTSNILDGDGSLLTHFDVVFTKDQSGDYRLVTTNPGQLFYQIEVRNDWPIIIDTLLLDISLPNDFILKGTNPIHVFLDGIEISNLCTIMDSTISIMNVPSGAIAHITIHIEYGLKGMIFPSIDDFELKGYNFDILVQGSSDSTSTPGEGLRGTYTAQVSIIAHQKKSTAIAGYVTDSNGLPIADVIIELFDINGILIDTTTTDEQGLYYFLDITANTYVVKAYYNNQYYSQTTTVGNKELAEVDFLIE